MEIFTTVFNVRKWLRENCISVNEELLNDREAVMLYAKLNSVFVKTIDRPEGILSGSN